MSTGTLTLTVDNGNANAPVQFIFTGTAGYTLTCLISVNGGAPGAARSMNTFSINTPASASLVTIVLSDVVGTGSITSFRIGNGANLITKVATSNATTWALSTDPNLSGLLSLSTAFSNADKLTSVPSGIPTSVTDLSQMFSSCNVFNGITNTNGVLSTTISAWDVSNVTNMSGMFSDCLLFNNNGASLWNNGTSTASVTNMSGMFSFCPVFNAPIGNWNTSAVTNMAEMFNDALAFNQDIGNWDVSNVDNMTLMFGGTTPAFNQNITYWTVKGSVVLTDMFAWTSDLPPVYGAFYIRYYNVDEDTYGDNSGQAIPQTTPTAGFFGQPAPVRNPCFMKGTQILCLRAEEEVYRPVQDLRKGDLVKTYRNGYLPIHMIGTSSLSNPGDEVRIPNRLYKCSKDLYPDLFEDLYITGCHSILVPALTNDQWENTKEMLGNVYITDNHFRLMACVDEKAQPYKRDAMIDIYHIALENDDYYMNYGVYANGLLVETCSKRYLTELSNMRIIGEDEACYDTPKVNVFSELGAFVQTY